MHTHCVGCNILNNDQIVGFGPMGNLNSSASACQYWASGPVLFITAGDREGGAGVFRRSRLGGRSFRTLRARSGEVCFAG